MVKDLKKYKKGELIKFLIQKQDAIKALLPKMERLEQKIEDMRADFEHQKAYYEQTIDEYRWRFTNQRDTLILMCERSGASPEEITQLGVGKLIPGDKERGIEPSVEYYSIEDFLVMSEDAMKRQATVAKFRQLKQHFVTHQKAMTVLLDQLNDLGQQNYITKEDLRKFQQVRQEVSASIRRTI